jgi:hypothetical protein
MGHRTQVVLTKQANRSIDTDVRPIGRLRPPTVRRPSPTLFRMKTPLLVFAEAFVFLATVGAAAVQLWIAAELWRGHFRWKVPGIERLTPEARLAFARQRSAVLLIATLWIVAPGAGIVWLGLSASAWNAVLSITAAIVVCGYHLVAAKYGIKRA